MRGVNHIVGGLAFTGIFASFADINIFSEPEYIGATVFFSLLPDIDHTKSPIGKLFYPVAKWLDVKYGHRTVTHSLLFLLAVVVFVALVEQVATGGRVLTGIAALACFSHLLFDMCTRQGIPFFLPFTRARCVLPGNPDLRLSNRAPVAETIIFFGFGLLLLTTYPLMLHGFWSSVNNTLATWGRVADEHSRHRTIIELTTEQGHRGHVVEATADGAVLWTGREFVRLSHAQGHKPKHFYHLSAPRTVVRHEFADITADSLRRILRCPVMSLQASATLPIRYRVGGLQFEQHSLKLDYPQPGRFDFHEVKPDPSAQLAQVARHQAIISQSHAIASKFRAEHAQKRARVADLGHVWAKLSDYEQGKATDEIAKLRAELSAARPPDPGPDVALAAAEITRLKTALATQKHTFTGFALIWKP